MKIITIIISMSLALTFVNGQNLNQTQLDQHTGTLKAVAQVILQEKGQFVKSHPLEISGESHLHATVSEYVASFSLLDLQTSEIQELLEQGPALLNLALPGIAGNQYELLLKRQQITAPDFRVITSAGDTIIGAEDNGLHYQGIVRDQPNSLVAISIFEEEVMGFVSTGKGNLVLGKLKGERTHILYNDLTLHATNPFRCHIRETDDDSGPANSGTQRGTTNCVQLYWEVNNDIFQEKGNMTNTLNFVMGIFNQHRALFANDDISVVFSEVFVWVLPSVYVGTTSQDILGAFENFTASFNGDLALLIGYWNPYNMGGLANLDGLCRSDWDKKKAMADINSSYSLIPTYSWTVHVITHEEGHLLGSKHTHACDWNGNNTAIDGCGPTYGAPQVTYEGNCSGAPIPSNGGTIMSYCHLGPVGINFNFGFGTQPKNVIVDKINNANCLTTCGVLCLPVVSLTSSISNTQVVEAGLNIFASNNLTSNSYVTYDAGLFIELTPGFRAQSGCSFRGYIGDGCGPMKTDLTLEGSNLIEDAENPVVSMNDVTLSGYPNPFDKSATFTFNLQEEGVVSLMVYGIMGHKTIQLVDNQRLEQGPWQFHMKAEDLPSGIYFCTLNVNGRQVAAKKLVKR